MKCCQTYPSLCRLRFALATVIHNNTTNKEYAKTVAYQSSHSSAEWIQERVSDIDGAFYPLNDFGSITFQNAIAEVDGEFKSLPELGAKPFMMATSRGQVLATTSALDATGAFTVTRATASTVVTPSYATVVSEDPGVIVITFSPQGISVNGMEAWVGRRQR
jgi:hypothetical protein